MNRTKLLLGVVLAVAAVTAPLQAQKPQRRTPVLVGAPGAPPAPATSQPAAAATAQPAAAKPARATPTLAGPQATPPTATPTPAAAGVQPQATGVPAAPAAATTSAGMAMEPFNEEEGEIGAYARRFAIQLDSAIAALVTVFRNTSGQPLAGAAEAGTLSQRERDRWGRCRDLHWDLQTFVAAAHDLPTAFEEAPALQRAAAALDSSLTAFQATSECDNVASMIAAPERWVPWGEHYETAARAFYTSWYPQAREAHERARALVVVLNPTLAAGERIPVPPALPRNAPYAGAGVR